MRTLQALELDAKMLTIEIVGDIDTYARTFLQLFNNVRENNELLKIENGYDNQVFIYCTINVVEELKNWLQKFDNINIIDCDDVIAFAIDSPRYDNDKYFDHLFVEEHLC